MDGERPFLILTAGRQHHVAAGVEVGGEGQDVGAQRSQGLRRIRGVEPVGESEFELIGVEGETAVG